MNPFRWVATWMLAAFLLLATGNAKGQSCFFSDDYSDPTRWTQLNSGIAVVNGQVAVTNSSGGSVPSVQRGIFQPLPQPLSDNGGWRLEIDLDYRTTGQNGTGLMVVTVTAGNQHPLNIFPNGTQIITPQDCIGIINTGALGRRSPIPLSIFCSDNGVWAQSDSLTLRQNAISYLRLERLNSGMLKLSSFVDPARTQHQTSSPVCYMPPGQYTGLRTVWHANLPQGADSRNDNAFLDNLCLSAIPVLDSAFTAQVSRTRICLGETLTLTAANADYAPISWTTTTPGGSGWNAQGASVTYTPPVAGTYVFTATGTLARFCNRTRTHQLTVEVVAQDVASVAYAQPTFCRTGTASVTSFSPAGGTFSGSAGLVINATTGQIDLAASTAGAHTVTYTTRGFCAAAATFPLTIQPLDVTRLTYPQNVYCRAGTTPVPAIQPTGGTFSGPPGLVLNPTTGVIDLGASLSGTYSVTYTSAGVCPTTATFAVRIDPVDVATLAYPAASFCRLGTTPPPTVQPGGGRFSGSVGLVLNPATGVIDLAASALGPHTVTYTSAGLCPTMVTFPLTVNPLDVTTLTYGQPVFCRSAPNPPPTMTPAGGRFSGSGGLVIDPVSGVIDLAATPVGGYTVTYTSAGVCPMSTTTSLTVAPVEVVAARLPDSVYCQAGATPAPIVLPPGGRFSGPARLVFDPQTGVVNLARSAVGTYVLTYTSAGTCAATAQVRLRIAARQPTTLTYADSLYCPNGRAAVQRLQPGGAGLFVGTPGLALDARSGTIDLVASAPGRHRILFTPDDPCSDPAETHLTIAAPFSPVLPNVITPNCDGLNESFGLPTPLPVVSRYELMIYNRWGVRVYHSTDPAAPWTAADVAAGTYYYLLQFADCAGRDARVKSWVEVVK